MIEFNTMSEGCFFILCVGVMTVKSGLIKKEVNKLVFINLPGLFM
jgi:hypothetical protein